MAAALVAPMLRALRGVGGAGAPRPANRPASVSSATPSTIDTARARTTFCRSRATGGSSGASLRTPSRRHSRKHATRKSAPPDAKKRFTTRRISQVPRCKNRNNERCFRLTFRFSYPPLSAALVNQEHVHRLTGGTNHVVNAFDRRQRRNKSPVNAADWAHLLPEAETGCLLLAPEHEEGWWRHSVVLVLNHDDEGSTGVTEPPHQRAAAPRGARDRLRGAAPQGARGPQSQHGRAHGHRKRFAVPGGALEAAP